NKGALQRAERKVEQVAHRGSLDPEGISVVGDCLLAKHVSGPWFASKLAPTSGPRIIWLPRTVGPTHPAAHHLGGRNRRLPPACRAGTGKRLRPAAHHGSRPGVGAGTAAGRPGRSGIAGSNARRRAPAAT